jgi:hypothetical protein
VQHGAVVACRFLIAGGDTAELLELGEEALDEVAFLVERLVERPLAGPGGVVGDDGDGARRCNAGAKVVSIVGRIRQDRRWPAVRMSRIGQPRPRTSAWILVLKPPRERPMA